MSLTTVYPTIQQKVNDYLISVKGNELKIYIAELGQVEKIKARLSGRKFTNQECMEGFALSLFSSQTDWGIIQRNMDLIRNNLFTIKLREYGAYSIPEIEDLTRFFKENGFNKTKLYDDLYSLKQFCAYMKNRSFEEDDFDLFNEYSRIWGNGNPHNVRELLSRVDEFRGMGIALSAEFLKNIGFDVAKPDVHIMRLLSTDKLGFGTWQAQEQSGDYARAQLFAAIDIIADASRQLGVPQAEIDNVLWLYCARSYCNICGSTPKCDECPRTLVSTCNFNGNNRTSDNHITEANSIEEAIPAKVVNQTKPVLVETSISSAGNDSRGRAQYKRLRLPKSIQHLVDLRQNYRIRYHGESVIGRFSHFYEMDDDRFLNWCGCRYSPVILDISEISNRVLTIVEIKTGR